MVEEVMDQLKNEPNPPDIIIGADTIVVLDEMILGKPKDKDEAYKTLKKLSGRQHAVYTGVIIKLPDKTEKFFDKTDVSFVSLSDEVINAYIATGEPMDRAGSYAIQNLGGTFVKSIQGDFFNVVGLPLHKFSQCLYDLFKSK